MTQLSVERRKAQRVGTSWDQSIRLFLKQTKNGKCKKDLIKMVNASDSGVCIEVPRDVGILRKEEAIHLLFQVGNETTAFMSQVKWLSPCMVPESVHNGGSFKYGTKIDELTHSNPKLFHDYVRRMITQEKKRKKKTPPNKVPLAA